MRLRSGKCNRLVLSVHQELFWPIESGISPIHQDRCDNYGVDEMVSSSGSEEEAVML